MLDKHSDNEEMRDSDSASNPGSDHQVRESDDEDKANGFDGEDEEMKRHGSRSPSEEGTKRSRSGSMDEKMSVGRSRSRSVQRSRSRSASGEKRADRSRSRSRSRKKKRTRSRSRSRSKRSESKETSKSRSRSPRKRRSRSRSPRRSRRRSSSRGYSRRRRSRSRSRRRTRRSRSRSPYRRRRSRSSSAGYRLHIADLDVDTSKRDLEKLFEPYGEIREIWMARSPPCFAFVVFEKRRDADEALQETQGAVVRHNRIRVTEARPRARGGRSRNAYDPNMRCYQCGQVGHFSRDCNETRSGYRRPQSPRRRSRRSYTRSRSRSRSRRRSRS